MRLGSGGPSEQQLPFRYLVLFCDDCSQRWVHEMPREFGLAPLGGYFAPAELSHPL